MFVANFIGSTPMNLVPRGDVVVGVRPEYLTPAATGLFTGSVSIVENLGVTSLVTLDCGEDQIGYTVPEDDEPAVGTTVTVDAPPARVLRYDKETGLLVR